MSVRLMDGWWWPPGLVIPETVEVRGRIRFSRLTDRQWDDLLGHLADSGSRLAERSVGEIVEVLGRVGERFGGELLGSVAQSVVNETGFSPPMARKIVEGMAKGWSREALGRLVTAEFPDPAVLEGFVERGDRRIRALGRGPTLHIGAGSVPGVAVTSLIRALLVKCPSLVKPGLGDAALTVAFLQALHDEDPGLASCTAASYWPGGSTESAAAEERLLGWASQVVVYGGNEVVTRVRREAPPTTPVLCHAHRVGIVVADSDTESGQVAQAAALFDQRGCVSPHVVLFLGSVEEADAWSAELADALEGVETDLPLGVRQPDDFSVVHQLRGTIELRVAAGDAVRIWYRPGEAWTVVRSEIESVVTVGGRTLWVVPCALPEELAGALRTLGPVLQSVGIDGPHLAWVADVAAEAGATRIAPIEDLPFPPADWLHDGQRPLRELVRWVEWR